MWRQENCNRRNQGRKCCLRYISAYDRSPVHVPGVKVPVDLLESSGLLQGYSNRYASERSGLPGLF